MVVQPSSPSSAYGGRSRFAAVRVRRRDRRRVEEKARPHVDEGRAVRQARGAGTSPRSGYRRSSVAHGADVVGSMPAPASNRPDGW